MPEQRRWDTKKVKAKAKVEVEVKSGRVTTGRAREEEPWLI